MKFDVNGIVKENMMKLVAIQSLFCILRKDEDQNVDYPNNTSYSNGGLKNHSHLLN